MRLHRFYVEKLISSDKIDIPDRELANQWKNVFRYNVGSQVILFDGSGNDYLCLISSLRAQGASVAVVQKISANNKAKMNLYLCLGLIKKDNFEFAVQKVTEIGVTHIIPILCERSEKKNLNFERLKKVSIEAAEQSGRGDIPFVHDIISLPKLLSSDLLPNRAIYLNSTGEPREKILKGEIKDLAVFVGPEGGWSESEISIFSKHNIPAVSLGHQILRSETAATAISSLLLL